MKMRVKVEGKSYEVEVEMLDSVLPTAAAPAAPIVRTRAEAQADGAMKVEPKSTNSSAAKAAATPGPRVPPTGWHQVSEGGPGEVCAPVAGTVGEVRVKTGDAIKVGDAVLVIEVSKSVSTGEQPFAGSIRSLLAGTVRDVLIKKGDAVKPGQVLARIG